MASLAWNLMKNVLNFAGLKILFRRQNWWWRHEMCYLHAWRKAPVSYLILIGFLYLSPSILYKFATGMLWPFDLVINFLLQLCLPTCSSHEQIYFYVRLLTSYMQCIYSYIGLDLLNWGPGRSGFGVWIWSFCLKYIILYFLVSWN